MQDPDDAAPAPGSTALLIIDMITDLRFPGGDALAPAARAAADTIARLRAEADARGVPIVYVNDNYGQWHSERSRLIQHVLDRAGESGEIVRTLEPRKNDFFVIKPQFSGFYATNLPVLLPKLGVSRLILTGMSADICVLFTAADAHMRDYTLWVPGDAVASTDVQRTRWALDIMAQSMHAETRPTGELSLATWLDAA